MALFTASNPIAGYVIVSKEDARILIIMQNEHTKNCPLSCLNRFVHPSTLLIAASFCSRLQRPTTRQHLENKTRECSAPIGTSINISPPPTHTRLWNLLGRGSREILIATVAVIYSKAVICWAQQSHCIHELIVTTTTCLRSATQNPNTAVGGAHKLPLLAEELLTAGSTGGRRVK